MFRIYLKTVLVMVAFLLILPVSAFSQSSISKRIINDLSTMEGVFIKTSESRNIINKGVKDGVKKGDLWKIFSKGEPVIDPSTGKNLGSFPVPLAVCKVINTQASFSEVQVKCLTGKCKVKSGQKALRFKNVDAIFMDTGGKAYSLYESVRAGLPSLNWKGYKQIENVSDALPVPYGVLILSQKNRITIWSGGEILLMDVPRSVTQPVSQISPVVTPPVLSPVKKEKDEKKLTIAPALMMPGLTSSIKIKDIRAVGSIDRIVLSMGIMESDKSGPPFFAYLSQKTVYVDTFDGRERYTYHYDGFGEILNMITGKDNLIILNIFVQGEGMQSRIISFENNGFQVIAEDINYILTMSDTNGDGINDSLFGQNFDDEDFLGGNTYLLTLESGSIKRITKMPSMPSFNIMGAFIADLNGNGEQEIGFYNAGRKFVIYEKDNELWESSSLLGGSIKNILYDDPLSNFDAPKQISVWGQPAMINSGGNLFVAVPANEPGLLTVVGGGPQKGGLGILSINNGNYVFRKIDAQFQGPVQSVFVYKNELYMAVVEGNLFTGQGKTHVLAVPLSVITEK